MEIILALAFFGAIVVMAPVGIVYLVLWIMNKAGYF